MMAHARFGPVLRQIRKLIGPAAVDVSDAELLERFATRREEAAFEALLERHGPMVLGVCRRVLRHPHDAEDAFQATFLVLARKAGSVRRRGSVGGWLYEVAYHAALKARAEAVRRHEHEGQARNMTTSDPETELAWRELRLVLDEELGRLPRKYRLPLVLCYLDGKSNREVARELGWPAGSMARRLARARELLRDRLTRRGVALSGALFIGLLAERASAAVPAALTAPTVRAGLLFAAGHAAAGAVRAPALTLAEAVLHTMRLARAKLLTAVFMAVTVLGTGAGLFALAGAGPPRAVDGKDGDPPAPVGERGRQPPAAAAGYGEPLPPGAFAAIGSLSYRHGHFVSSVVYSPDGKLLASAGWDRTIRLWDTATGKEVRRLEGHLGHVLCVAFSPDGKSLVSGGREGPNQDRPLRLWEVATGRELRPLTGFLNWNWGQVGTVAYSPDGRNIASAGRDQMVRLWDVASGKEIGEALAQNGEVRAVAFSPDGKLLASAGADQVVRLWEVGTRKELRQLEGHAGGTYAVAFAPDGKTVASGGEDHMIRFWETATGREVRAVQGHERPVRAVCFSPDGKTLGSAGCRDYDDVGEIRLWEVATGKERRRPRGHYNLALTVAFSPDGKTLASGGADNVVRFWDVATGNERPTSDGHAAQVVGAVFSPDGKLLASGSDDHTIRLWDPATGKEVRRLVGHEGMVQGVAFSPNGKQLVSAGRDGTVRIWETDTGKEVRRFQKEQTWYHCVAFAPDGKLVAAGSGEVADANASGLVQVWEVETGKEVRLQGSLGGHRLVVRSVAFSSDGKTLASAGNDGWVNLWDVITGLQTRQLENYKEAVESVAFSPDGRLLASAAADRTVRVWDVAAGRLLRRLDAPGDWYAYLRCTVAFSPDGKTLAAGSWRSIRLWETATGAERRAFTGHRGDVRSVSFSPDGRVLASAGGDTTILLWDLTGRRKDGRLARSDLPPNEIDNRWADLAGDDAGRAYDALWALTSAPEQAVSFLKTQLRAPAPPDPRRIEKLVAELDDDDFGVREGATVELGKLGEPAAAALRKVLAGTPSAEVRRRAELLLKKLQSAGPSPDQLRALRAIEVLEQIGTPGARELLGSLAKGAPGGGPDPQAKAALERLSRRQ
jgi:RNA polymerase sigma factor (sigma-70 family)